MCIRDSNNTLHFHNQLFDLKKNPFTPIYVQQEHEENLQKVQKLSGVFHVAVTIIMEVTKGDSSAAYIQVILTFQFHKII